MLDITYACQRLLKNTQIFSNNLIAIGYTVPPATKQTLCMYVYSKGEKLHVYMVVEGNVFALPCVRIYVHVYVDGV